MNSEEEKLRLRFEIIRLFEEGLSQRKISETISVPKTTIQNTIAKYCQHSTVMRLYGSGRQKSLSKEDKKVLRENIAENPKISAKKLSDILAEKTNKIVSVSTIQRGLKEDGFLSAVPRKLPLLSQKNIQDRLEKATAWSNWTLKAWDRVLFSDETKINLFSSDGRIRVWRKPKTSHLEHNSISTVKHGGGGTLVWGCMSSNGTGKLVFIDSIMDKVLYKRILVENLNVSADILGLGEGFIFQQDNDPKHTSKYVAQFFEYNDIDVLKWPSQSPDLNPIEHLWDFVKRELRKYDIKNIRELRSKITEIWGNISKEECRKLVYSMPKRIEEVIRAKGKNTTY
jgi:transposase